MTAAVIAALLNARRAGKKWVAKCPAHPDRHPSLTIMQGHSGVLLKCWSRGCSIESIVTALNLPMSALFDGPQLTPEQRRQAMEAKTIRDAEQARQCAIDREQRDRVFKLERLMDAIGAKLARSPDDREIGKLFHQVCERWHDAESAMPHHEDGPLRGEPMPQSPGWIADALVEVGQTFGSKETARCERAA